MAEAIEQFLQAESYGHEPTRVVASSLGFARSERLRRAALAFFPLSGAALLSLFIPAWHFFGVPGFLIAAVGLGLRRLREETRMERLSGCCPACEEPRSFPTPSHPDLPLTLACPGCGEFIHFSRAPVPSGPHPPDELR